MYRDSLYRTVAATLRRTTVILAIAAVYMLTIGGTATVPVFAAPEVAVPSRERTLTEGRTKDTEAKEKESKAVSTEAPATITEPTAPAPEAADDDEPETAAPAPVTTPSVPAPTEATPAPAAPAPATPSAPAPATTTTNAAPTPKITEAAPIGGRGSDQVPAAATVKEAPLTPQPAKTAPAPIAPAARETAPAPAPIAPAATTKEPVKTEAATREVVEKITAGGINTGNTAVPLIQKTKVPAAITNNRPAIGAITYQTQALTPEQTRLGYVTAMALVTVGIALVAASSQSFIKQRRGTSRTTKNAAPWAKEQTA